MERIGEELSKALPGVRLAALHRVGALSVGDLAVVCAASAPHRAEAFLACRRLIDEIKARVPIWKREWGPDGPYWINWIDARCAPDEHHEHHAHHTHDR
jgi:molybdopterin synthase catalytic subunit